MHCACSASLKCPEDRSEITPLQREAGFREKKKGTKKERGGVNESGAEAEIRMTADGTEAKVENVCDCQKREEGGEYNR